MSNNTEIKPVITPIGSALWAKITEPQSSQYNPTPMYSMDIVYTPEEANDFKLQLNNLLDAYYDEVHAGLNDAKKKTLTKNDIFKEHTDKDGNLTGNLVIKTKQYGKSMKGDVMPMPISDASGKVIPDFKTLVANGSKVRAKVYPKPYHMASTNSVGISLRLNAVQIVELIPYEQAGGGFGSVDGGYTAPEQPAPVEADEDF